MSNIHLLVLIHGMWGNPGHVSELHRIIRETYAQTDEVQLEVLLAEANREDSTYDGIDWGGERVAQEILDKIDEFEQDGRHVSKFSVTGYSLGGLVARYVVGILHQRKFFEIVVPVNFNTIATPHLGLLRYSSIFSYIREYLGPKLLSRTGEQFYCADQWSTTKKPLLEVLSDPDRIFYQALSLFKHIRIYANAINDVTVPYVTSAIELEDVFACQEANGLEVELDKDYTHLIKDYTLPLIPPPRPKFLSPDWIRKKRRILPPALHFNFPYNIIIYMLLPILIPLGFSVAIIRFSLATRSSRARIRLMEKDESKLIHNLEAFEKKVEQAVEQLIEGPGFSSSLHPEVLVDNDNVISNKLKTNSSDQPVLTPVQRKIAISLNTLPIQKELAYIPHVANAHGIIVCRDVKRFKLHRLGEGIIQHWATSFVP